MSNLHECVNNIHNYVQVVEPPTTVNVQDNPGGTPMYVTTPRERTPRIFCISCGKVVELGA